MYMDSKLINEHINFPYCKYNLILYLYLYTINVGFITLFTNGPFSFLIMNEIIKIQNV